MLTIFFTITFIAELIIAGWIISVILKLDKIVCTTNQQVTDYRPILQENLTKTKAGVNKTLTALTKFVTFINEKKCECKDAFEKNIITSILCIILKLPFKKIISALEVALMLKKLLRK